MTRTQFTNDSDSSAGQISIRISPYIEREFKRRDIFHELRLEKAYRKFLVAQGIIWLASSVPVKFSPTPTPIAITGISHEGCPSPTVPSPETSTRL